MKTVLITLMIVIGLFACNSNQVTISKEEYDNLKGINPVKPEYPKDFHFYGSWFDTRQWHIILGSDNHEYLENDGAESFVSMHYVDCKLCRSRVGLTPVKEE